MRKLVKLLLTLSLMAPAAALALGLGEIKLHSALNQTLDADIELLSVDPAEADGIEVSLASAETFSKVGLRRPAVLMMVNFEVKRRQSGTYYVKATSREPIREPFLDFLVEVEWPSGRVMREYTLLLDPPVSYRAEAPAVTAPTTTPTQPAQAQPMVEPAPVAPAQPEPSPAAAPEVTAAEEDEEFIPPPSAIPGAAAAPTPAPEPVPEPMAEAKPEPVEEPAPVAKKPAPAPKPPSSLNYGVVKANDTLWEVALKLRPNRNISVQQMMMALQRANPDAFINNNINLLKKGYVLRIDDPALLTAMSKAEAVRQVARQTREWEDYRAAVAQKAEQRQPAAGAEVTAGAASATKAEPKLKLVAPDDKAKEAGSAADGEATGGDADEELMLALESSAAQQKENESLQGRVQELEEQLQDMQKLLTLKNEDLKTLQDQLAKQREAAGQAAPAESQPQEEVPVEEVGVDDETVTDESEKETAPETDDEMMAPAGDGQEESPSQPEQAEDAATPSDEQPAEEGMEKSAEEAAAEDEMAPSQAKDAEVKQEPAVGTEPKAATSQPAPKPQPVSESFTDISSLMGYVDMLMKDPIMLAAGGGTAVLLLILGLLLVRRRSKGGGFQESILSGGTSSMLNANADELDGETSFLSDLAISGMGGGAITTDEGEVDPLTEADVFMAYGRNQQAEEVLNKALESNPDRPELIAKLLEVYYNEEDKEQFEALINQSGDKVQSNDELWNKIAPMGQKLIPENALFGGTGAPSGKTAQQSEAVTDDVLDIGLDLDELGAGSETETPASDDSLDLGIDFDLDEETKPAEGSKPAEEPADDLSDLDFDLDLGADTEESVTDTLDIGTGADTAEESSELEFDLSGFDTEETEELGGLDTEETEDFSGFDLEEAEEEKPAAAGGDELGDLDFGDFGVESEEAEAEEELGSFELDTGESAETTDDSLDLGDLDFGELGFESGEETETAVETPAASEAESDAFDLSDLDAGSGLDDFGDLDDEGILSDSEEMTTKLDLAQAYIEMGDNEGARTMLEEVAEGGNDEQQQQAQELLSKV